MILIVEGSDLVGKSTIADAIGERRGWPVVKIRWALKGDPEVETRAIAKTTIAILDATRPDVILDRAYFSWWAYGPVLGHDVDYMPDLISRFNPIDETRVVVLTAAEEELRRRFELQPDHWFPLEVILGANRRFPSLVDLLPHNLPCLMIDTSVTPIEDGIEQVDAFISTPARHIRRLPRLGL